MVRLQHTSDPLYNEFWLPLYRSAFPDNERIPEEEIASAFEDANTYIVVGCTSEGTPVSMAYCVACNQDRLPPYLYLIYLATIKEERGRGWGGLFFELLTTLESESNTPPQALLLEVQDIAEAAKVSDEEKNDAIRRLRFYEKHDCFLLQGSRYIQRVEGYEGVFMQLLYRRFQSSLTAERAFNIAQATFGEDDVTQVGPLSWSQPTVLEE